MSRPVLWLVWQAAYASIGGGSPIVRYTRAQAAGIESELQMMVRGREGPLPRFTKWHAVEGWQQASTQEHSTSCLL